MILRDNKVDINFDKIYYRVYSEETDICISNAKIWYKKDMNISNLILSNNLIDNIYNEIDRE